MTTVDPAGGVFLILLLFVVVFAIVARKLETPYPIVLVIAGLILSLIPGTPRIQLNPRLIFTVVLAAASLRRGLADVVARVPPQSGQHHLRRLRPGRLHHRRRRLRSPSGSFPDSIGGLA